MKIKQWRPYSIFMEFLHSLPPKMLLEPCYSFPSILASFGGHVLSNQAPQLDKLVGQTMDFNLPLPLKAVSPFFFFFGNQPLPSSHTNTLTHIQTQRFQKFVTPSVSFASDIHLPGFGNCPFPFLSFHITSKRLPWRYDVIEKASRTSKRSEEHKVPREKHIVG